MARHHQRGPFLLLVVVLGLMGLVFLRAGLDSSPTVSKDIGVKSVTETPESIKVGDKRVTNSPETIVVPAQPEVKSSPIITPEVNSNPPKKAEPKRGYPPSDFSISKLITKLLAEPPTTGLPLLYPATAQQLEANQPLLSQWLTHLVVSLSQPVEEPVKDWFSTAMKTWDVPLKRYGGDDDGGKLLYDVDNIKAPCVIYSLGSANDFKFEDSMLESTSCVVHTFDCTVETPEKKDSDRFKFHKWCIGDGGSQLAVSEVLKRLGHAKEEIALFKMDIEGFEWRVFPSLFADGFYPQQISFELHYNLEHPARDVGRLFMLFHALGYRVINKDQNPYCPFCCEFTLLRVGYGGSTSGLVLPPPPPAL